MKGKIVNLIVLLKKNSVMMKSVDNNAVKNDAEKTIKVLFGEERFSGTLADSIIEKVYSSEVSIKLKDLRFSSIRVEIDFLTSGI